MRFPAFIPVSLLSVCFCLSGLCGCGNKTVSDNSISPNSVSFDAIADMVELNEDTEDARELLQEMEEPTMHYDFSSLPYNIEAEDDSLYVVDILEFLDTLPECVKDMLTYQDNYGNSCHIMIFNNSMGIENIYGFSNYDYAVGLYERSGNLLMIECCDHDNLKEVLEDTGINPDYLTLFTDEELSRRYTVFTFAHEMGHMVDEHLLDGDAISSLPEFAQIYRDEIDNFRYCQGYWLENCSIETNVASESEYFATSFAMYMLYPEDLARYAPWTSAYIEGYLRAVEQEKEEHVGEDSEWSEDANYSLK